MRGTGRDFGGERRRFSPINVGDTFDVKIEAVGEKGDGIAKKNGFVIFVPKTKEGDEVKVKITKVMRNFGFAEVAGQQSEGSESETESESEEAPAESENAEESPSEDAAESDEDSEDFGEE